MWRYYDLCCQKDCGDINTIVETKTNMLIQRVWIDMAEVSNEQEIQTIDPEKEPEYVGVHSALVAAECQHWVGETTEEIGCCEDEATHTVVMWTGTRLVQIASCDDCGEPDDLDAHDREWTGEVVDAPEGILTEWGKERDDDV